MSSKVIAGLILAFIASIIVGVITAWNYSQLYKQDSETTATTGIYFQKTLNLKEYKRVSDGNGLWGKYDRYSRSDRHNDVITVYCNDYCSKDK